MKPGSDKSVDFKILRDGSDILLDKLREDESVPDLKDQFIEKVNGGNHKYFLEPYFKQWQHPIVSICLLSMSIIEFLITIIYIIVLQ
mgnify:FL=1